MKVRSRYHISDFAQIAANIVVVIGVTLAVGAVLASMVAWCVIISAGSRRPTPTCMQGSIVSYLTDCEAAQ